MAHATRRSLYLLLIFLTLTIEDSHAQSFVLTGNMTTPRYGHSATLLQDGLVLVAGGKTPTGLPGTLSERATFTAEIYDPATGAFTETGSMTVGRVWHAAVLLQDGRVLMVGGEECYCIPSAELYDPVTGTFTSTGQTSVAQRILGAVLLKNGKVLVSGSSTIELFALTTGAFTPLNHVENYDIAMTLLSDGEVLLNTYSGLSLYDPANDGFRQLPIRWKLSGATATPLLDGSVFLAGGFTDGYGFDAVPNTYLYDPATQILERKPDMPFPRDSHTATLLKDGRVLISGGYNGDGDLTGIFSDADLYDPTTGRLSQTAGMIYQRDGHAATLLRDGHVLITGGRASTNNYRLPNPDGSSAELFIPESTQGSVPRLELDATRYCAGDTWTLRAESIAPLTSVQISGTRDGSPWTISDWKTSGEDGALDATGTYGADSVGTYTVWLYAGGKTSNTASVTVESCSVHLDLMNSKFPMFHTEFYMGDSWTLHVTSSLPGANVKLMGISQGTPWTIESWGRTGSDGSFTATGTFLFGSDGIHALRVIVGSAQSNQVRFRVIDY